MMKKYFVEFLGTMFIMFTIFTTRNWIAIGAALALAVLFGRPISGGAFNPAVAIAFYADEKLPETDLMSYIIAEILGGVAAFYAYKSFDNDT